MCEENSKIEFLAGSWDERKEEEENDLRKLSCPFLYFYKDIAHSIRKGQSWNYFCYLFIYLLSYSPKILFRYWSFAFEAKTTHFLF